MTEWSDAEADAALTYETIRYELQRFGVDVTFAPEVLSQMRIERFHSHVSREVAMRIVGTVATWRQERLLKVPANWWQHFKQRWFPAWALKRWPVLYTWYDAAVVLPRVPVVRPEYHTVEFPVWQRRGET